MDKDTLQYIAESDVWEKIKEFVLIPEILEIANVLNEVKVNETYLTGADAYNTKSYTAQKLQEMIRRVDAFKIKPSSPNEDFE